jgi:hypothetical protein
MIKVLYCHKINISGKSAILNGKGLFIPRKQDVADRTDISHLGHYSACHYFPEDTATAILLRRISS